jgi:DnaJ-class molecular chaperone
MERNYLSSENAICRRCLGEGVVTYEVMRVGHNRYAEIKPKRCDLCEGSGMVRVEKKIEVLITPKTPKPYGKE